MPTHKEIFEFEHSAPENTIRLIKFGEFYRAYDRSAWLFQNCIAEHKVMKRYFKALKTEIYFLGFPEKSLLGNIENRQFTKTEFGYDITLKEGEAPDPASYEVWKATVDTEVSSKADVNSMQLTGAEAEREVIKQIKDFQLESKTMIECVNFLAKLRSILREPNQ